MDDRKGMVGQLRGHVRELHGLLNYLESREALEGDDYAFARARMRDVIRQLKKTTQFRSALVSSESLACGMCESMQEDA